MRKRLYTLWQHLRTEHTSPARVGFAVFVGVWLGVIPLYGVQTPICIAVAQLLRLNKLTVVLAANISNPLFAPFLVAAGIAIGEYLRFGTVAAPDLGQATSFLAQLALFSGELPSLFVSCLIGDTLLGLVLGVVLGLVAWRVASRRAEAALVPSDG